MKTKDKGLRKPSITQNGQRTNQLAIESFTNSHESIPIRGVQFNQRIMNNESMVRDSRTGVQSIAIQDQNNSEDMYSLKNNPRLKSSLSQPNITNPQSQTGMAKNIVQFNLTHNNYGQRAYQYGEDANKAKNISSHKILKNSNDYTLKRMIDHIPTASKLTPNDMNLAIPRQLFTKVK